MGDDYKPGEASAVASRGLAWSDDALPCAIALDFAYQLMTVRFIYPLELIFTATVLALVPYALLRGPFNRLARLFCRLPGRRRQHQPTTINSFTEGTYRGRTKAMSSESKTQDWSKPAAMAIPKGGYFQDKVEQGRYGPIFPKTPASYGFSILAKIIPGREEIFYEYAKTSKTRSPRSRTPLPSCSCITCAGCSFRSKGTPTSCTKAFSTPTSINIPKTLLRSLASRAWDGVRAFSRVSLRTGRRTPPRSSSLSAIINARLPRIRANIRIVSADEVKKALGLKAAFSTMLDQMQ